MALDELERQFYEAATREGMPSDQIASRIRARRERTASPYKPTDYAGEAAKLPSRAGEYASLMERGLTPEEAVSSVHHTDLLQSGRRTPEQRTRDESPEANDPLAQMVLAGTLGAGAGSLAGAVVPRVLAPIVSGAVNSAAQSTVTGGDLEDIGKNALIGAAIPAAGKVAGAVGRRIRGGEGGQARALWEKHGGNVGPLDSGSGVDEIAGMEPSRNNVGRASEIGAQNIRKGLESDFEKTTGAPYRNMREAIDYSPASREAVDASSLVQSVNEVPASLRPALMQKLSDHGISIAEDGTAMTTQAKLLAAKQELDDVAKYGLNNGPGTGNIKDRSFKSVANAAKVLVDEGPYAEANAVYAEGMGRLGVDRQALGLPKERPRLESTVPKQDAKVGLLLRGEAADSEAAGARSQRADLPGFRARHPELERQVDLPDLLRAKGRLEFGLDHTKTANLHGLEEAAGKGWLRKALTLAGDNSAAFAGRYAYRPAGAGIVADDILSSPEMNKILAAYAAQKEQERRRAEALGR